MTVFVVTVFVESVNVTVVDFPVPGRAWFTFGVEHPDDEANVTVLPGGAACGTVNGATIAETGPLLVFRTTSSMRVGARSLTLYDWSWCGCSTIASNRLQIEPILIRGGPAAIAAQMASAVGTASTIE